MLEDSFGRRFYYLRLSITDVCNFRCDYCLPDGYQGKPDLPFLTVSEIENTVKAFAALGTEKVRLTGGEPSLRKDLPDIIRRVKNIEGIRTVALTTNGYKLPQKIESWKNAGLDQLNVSVDALDREEFHKITGHDRFEEVMAGIDKAIELGLKVKVNAVLMKGVNDDIKPVLKWLKSKQVSMRFIEVMETSDQDVFFRSHHLSGGLIKAQLLEKGWSPMLRNKADGPAQEFWHPDYEGRIGLIMPYAKDFCSTCNRLRISSLGKLHLCLFSEAGIDLRPYMSDEFAPEVLADQVRALLTNKKATHQLLAHDAGAMRNLSLIGG